ncbi:MAG: DUF2309 domain-containing protein [Myxococcaceae bacterium]|nr:DUF2309 domain-containing protein [Myxococcaceae bacterium]
MTTTEALPRETTPPALFSGPRDHRPAVDAACARIAPTWPLDRFIAVNPFFGMVGEHVRDVAGRLAVTSGAKLLMPRAWYREAYRDGRLRDEHLARALEQCGSAATLEQLRALLGRADPVLPVRARVADVADSQRDLVHSQSWRSFVTHSVSQFCAAYFDEGQATLGPDRRGGLYASWHRQALGDRAPALLMGFDTYAGCAAALPTTADALLGVALEALGVTADEEVDYLWSLLLDQNGWASWCAYRRWSARLAGGDDAALTELLAIRLAWELMLFRGSGEALAARWQRAKAAWPPPAAAAGCYDLDWVLQSALELAFREPVSRALVEGLTAERPARPAVQAVFCIDVRSEPYRRALERSAVPVQTLGFAGFFGLPIDYQPAGAAAPRPQLPGLLAPRLRVTDLGLGESGRGQRLMGVSAWRGFKADPVSTFTFVEAFGVSHAVALAEETLGLVEPRAIDEAGLTPAERARRAPRLEGHVGGEPLDAAARAELAAGMLRAMSLTHGFARLVLLAGHGSATRNNPHAAGLDCGACCGQTGEVNARAAAALLNEPAVRAGLHARGIRVPESTWFIAGLHNTTTDEVELFDVVELPASHRGDLAALRTELTAASAIARAERAPSLGLQSVAPERLAEAVALRARDWAQVRPEWGLAGNAAFIVAPREHCRHLDVKGRSFLHEYRHREDENHEVLELIMTAPMVVTQWINFQYYASTVDNEHYGSGNKVLHNVVGGHLGVFEGNGGDLRIGLPLQSLHDGSRWVHEPLRLAVYIEAPRRAIEAVLARHPMVRSLVENGWLDLFQLDDGERRVRAYRRGEWV